jgi:hypothetical protein
MCQAGTVKLFGDDAGASDVRAGVKGAETRDVIRTGVALAPTGAC